MGIRTPHKEQLEALIKEYLKLSKKEKKLLNEIQKSEIAESIFNSNAIENSTLNLKDTEKIIFDSCISKELELREVLEAKNLAQVYNLQLELDQESILKAHSILLNGIQDKVAGRFREKGENVRIANHVAPASEKLPTLVQELLLQYESDTQKHFLEKIAQFHLDFEMIHPFCDGNGRIGRVLINWQLEKQQCPPIIIRNSSKKKYYEAFRDYKARSKTYTFEKILLLALLESFHKRLAYLKKNKIVTLAEWVRQNKSSPSSIFNAAKRQSIPAFRENEVWMIGVDN